jgi:hypothetical protein
MSNKGDDLIGVIERLIDAKLRPRSFASSDNVSLNQALLRRDAQPIDAAKMAVGAALAAIGMAPHDSPAAAELDHTHDRCGKCGSHDLIRVPNTPATTRTSSAATAACATWRWTNTSVRIADTSRSGSTTKKTSSGSKKNGPATRPPRRPRPSRTRLRPSSDRPGCVPPLIDAETRLVLRRPSRLRSTPAGRATGQRSGGRG